MKIPFAALLCVMVVVVTFLLPGIPRTPIQNALSGILLLASLYLVWEGIGIAQRSRRESMGAGSPARLTNVLQNQDLEGRDPKADKIKQLETALASAVKREAELARQADEQVRRGSSLETALVAAENRAKAAKGQGADQEDQAETGVLNFLSLLQRKGRLVDFLMDDITQYPDAQVGAAARVVHQGCSEVIKEFFDIGPVRQDGEGSAVTLDKNYPSNQYRLVGRVIGQPPFRGTLLHRGWMANKIKLPKATEPTSSRREIIAPAEVELS
jgi:hypothetical protein